MKIVEVTWIDCSGRDGWQSKEQANIVPHTIRTVGYVMEDTDDYLSLVESLVDPLKDRQINTHGCALAIPKSAIRKRRNLK